MAEEYVKIVKGSTTCYAPSKNTFTKYMPIYRTLTLSTGGWNSSSLKQTLTCNGVSATETAQIITVTPKLSSQATWRSNGVRCTAQASNSLTFTCDTIPTASITVYVVIQRVSA